VSVTGVQTLREQGLHVTPQRLAVLEAVATHQHATADSVLDLVRSSIGTISRQTVYDALAALVEAGILRRIEPAGSPARYETRVGDNHHHVVCRSCGHISDVDCAVGDAPCLTAATDQGFRIDEAEVVYWGTCPQCTAKPHGSDLVTSITTQAVTAK
jgi:Fe2+ or Zn2+ uptake regulation protein